MTRPITPETILAECATIEDAKAVARDMRQTAIAVGNKYGAEHDPRTRLAQPVAPHRPARA